MAPAQADGHIVMKGNAEHCNPELFPNKEEVDAGPEIDTDLPEGTTVCIKAGRTVELTEVGVDGLITSPNGKGISYYAWGEVCVPTYEEPCGEGPS